MNARLYLALLLALFTITGHAQTRIAILDFELKDLTLAPGVPAEIQRTAALKPLLEQEFRRAGYDIVSIPPAAQQAANSGVGYLYDHPDVAAELGSRFHSDYVMVGRLHKPSFLFAYVMGRLVRVKDGQLVGDYVSESKGPSLQLAIKAIESLASKIDRDLDNRYSPPPPAKLQSVAP